MYNVYHKLFSQSSLGQNGSNIGLHICAKLNESSFGISNITPWNITSQVNKFISLQNCVIHVTFKTIIIGAIPHDFIIELKWENLTFQTSYLFRPFLCTSKDGEQNVIFSIAWNVPQEKVWNCQRIRRLNWFQESELSRVITDTGWMIYKQNTTKESLEVFSCWNKFN